MPWFGNAGNGIGGALFLARPTTLINCTLVENKAAGGNGLMKPGNGHGGAIRVLSAGFPGVHLSFSDNASQGGKGISYDPDGTRREVVGDASGGSLDLLPSAVPSTLINSLVQHGPGAANCGGVALASSHSLSSGKSCGFAAGGGADGVVLHLGTLDGTLGPTPTLALLAGSPAIDAADPADCPAVDQRGAARPHGRACGVGAFEASDPDWIHGRIERTAGGQMVAVFAGTPNREWWLEVSPDLEDWTRSTRLSTDGEGVLRVPLPRVGSATGLEFLRLAKP